MKTVRAVITASVAACLLYGCSKEITFRQNFEPKVVVNCLLNPDSLLKVDLWWSRNIDDPQPFRRVQGAAVTIFEDEKEILNAQSGEGAVVFDYKPREGRRYSLRVRLEGYDDVTASTVVPMRPTAECVFGECVEIPGTGGWGNDPWGYNHYELKNIEADGNTSALYLDVYSYYDPKYGLGMDWGSSQLSIYTGSIYTDPFNRSVFPLDAAYTGSPYEYYQFVRIPDSNIPETSPLRFAVWDNGWVPVLNPDGSGDGRKIEITNDITLTAAGEDYDRYYKTVFLSQYNSADVNPFVFEIYPVPSNVRNGLGIFAGYSSRTFRFDFNETEI